MPIQSPKQPEGTTKLNDKALCPITCPALSLHDSPLRSCRNQSNGSQMVEPGSPRPVTKAGHPASSAVWLSGNWHGCAVLRCVLSLRACVCCVCVCVGSGHQRRHPGTLPEPFPRFLSTLRKRGRSIFIHSLPGPHTTYGSQRVFPLPFPLRSWNLSWRPSPPHPGLLRLV